MKNIRTYLPFIAIAGLIAFAIFGGRTFGQPGSQSDKQFASMNLISIMASPYSVSVPVNVTSSNLTINAVYSQNATGAFKVVTNNLSFKSNNVEVAVVSAGGQVKGVSVGTTTVTVTYVEGNVTKTCDVPVTITAPPAPPGT